MGIGHPFNEPFYGGAGTSTLTPYITDAALGGHNYLIDHDSEASLVFKTVPLLRAQSDDSDKPGEQSINPEGFWRRSGESWHFGAGQEQFDRKDSNEFRFRGSRGVNVWDKWGFSLLPDTDAKFISGATNQKLVVAGSFLYYTDGATLRRTGDITPDTPTFTAITGTPGTQPTDICSDGFNVITCHGASGIYKTTRGAATTAVHITGTVSKLAFVKNRFLASNNNAIYDITSLTVGGGGALPAAYFTHANTDFSWVGFAEGDAAIYAAGYSGDKSLIYKITVKADGTALDAPIICGHLPDGEVVSSIYGYLGRFVAIGTNKGVRLAVALDSGDLSIGALIPLTLPTLCFEGQDKFIYFGWGNFDSTHTGLGRLSVQSFTDTELIVPAYASDLMVDELTANVTSVVTFNDIQVFSLSGSGIWAQHNTDLVMDGYIDTGEISYGMTEPKIGISIDAQHFGDHGMHEIFISADGGPFISLGIHTHDTFPRSLGTTRAAFFEFRHMLHRDEMDPTMGLSVHSWLMLVQPLADVTQNIFATFYIAPEVDDLVGNPMTYAPFDELDYISSLALSKEVTTFQVHNRLYSVVVEDYELPVHSLQRGQSGLSGFNGSVLVKMKVVA